MANKPFVNLLNELTEPVRETIRGSEMPQTISPACLQKAVRAYPELAGKMMRPGLTLGACGMFDESSMPSAVPIAAAAEVFHDWTLVHDDIIDNDDLRRGKPATHRLVAEMTPGDEKTTRKFGVDMAILAGDIQQEWANLLILEAEIPASVRIAILKRLNGFVGPQLISGEAEDVEFELREFSDISSTEMMDMLRKKTGLLLRFAAESGVMVALGVDDHLHTDVKNLGEFAETVGLAFQLQDDLLGMFADESKLGKPVGSDLRQGKRTYLFAKTLELASETQCKHLLKTLGNPDSSPEDVLAVLDILDSCGAKKAVEDEINHYRESAEALLRDYPDSRFKEFLLQWAEFACNRAY